MMTFSKKNLNLDLSESEQERAKYETSSKFNLIKQMKITSPLTRSKYSKIILYIVPY